MLDSGRFEARLKVRLPGPRLVPDTTWNMPLAVGSRLGHYDVTALIGQGGMGEVYRAHDTKLGRDVALKILPGLFADDPERLPRFQR